MRGVQAPEPQGRSVSDRLDSQVGWSPSQLKVVYKVVWTLGRLRV